MAAFIANGNILKIIGRLTMINILKLLFLILLSMLKRAIDFIASCLMLIYGLIMIGLVYVMAFVFRPEVFFGFLIGYLVLK